MQTRVKFEISKRYDGKFNVWRKDGIYQQVQGKWVLIGDWIVVNVCDTEEEARSCKG